MLKLKLVLKDLQIEQSRLAYAIGISAAAIAQITNHDIWPKKKPAAAYQARIREFLKKNGATDEQVGSAFEKWTPPARAASQAQPQEEEPIMLLRKQTLHPKTRQHFGLVRNPFSEVASAEEVYQNDAIRYTRLAMLDAAKRGGFMAVIGESGSGKSTLRRDLIERIHRESEQVRIIQPFSIIGMADQDTKGNVMRASHIATAILAEISPHITVPSDSETRFRRVSQELMTSHQAGNRHVLIIEEAHALPIPTLNHLKRFTELEAGFARLLSIILVGQPELAAKLSEQNAAVREVVQRCEIMTLPPLGSHLPEYLEFRFKQAGTTLKKVMTDDAVQAIHDRLQPPVPRGHKSYSLLYPLAVHNLTTAALNLAAENGAPVVSADVINEV
ncbi:ExeA family protein [Pseudomonas aeruginosa]